MGAYPNFVAAANVTCDGILDLVTTGAVWLRVVAAAFDACGAATVTAELEVPCGPATRRIPVAPGQVIRLKPRAKRAGCKVESEHGILEIKAVGLTLVVTAVDGAGNLSTPRIPWTPPARRHHEGDHDDH